MKNKVIKTVDWDSEKAQALEEIESAMTNYMDIAAMLDLSNDELSEDLNDMLDDFGLAVKIRDKVK